MLYVFGSSLRRGHRFATIFLTLTLGCTLGSHAFASERLVRSSGRALRNNSATPDPTVLEKCFTSAENFKLKSQADEFRGSCAAHQLVAASASSVKMSSDGNVFACGFPNILYIQEKGSEGSVVNIIAGSNSNLSNVRAITIDSKNKEVFVIDGASEKILVFRIGDSGNMSPARIIDNPDIAGATGLSVDTQNDLLYVANPAKNEIQVLNRLANRAAPREEFEQKIRRVIRGPQTQLQQPMSISLIEKTGQIAVVDSSASKILIFNSNQSGDVAPSAQIPIQGDNVPAVVTAPDSNEAKIQVLFKSGQTQELKL